MVSCHDIYCWHLGCILLKSASNDRADRLYIVVFECIVLGLNLHVLRKKQAAGVITRGVFDFSAFDPQSLMPAPTSSAPVSEPDGGDDGDDGADLGDVGLEEGAEPEGSGEVEAKAAQQERLERIRAGSGGEQATSP